MRGIAVTATVLILTSIAALAQSPYAGMHTRSLRN